MLRQTRKALLHKSTGLTHLAGTALFLGAGLFTQAHAQTTAAAKPATAEKVAQGIAPAEADKTKPERIIVTGSRIRSREYTAASKIQVITANESLAAGRFSAAEIFQGASPAAGSLQINSTIDSRNTEFTTGINTVGLRGLAARRTLVLLNGRRMAPSGTGGNVGAVDLNSLPGIAIDRSEILTDGASSIYGSDAVAGVVNAITRSNFTGFEARVGGYGTEHGGGGVETFGAIYGRDLSNGHFTISAEQITEKALREGDRPYLGCAEDYLFKKNGERADGASNVTPPYLCVNTDRLYGGAFVTSEYKWRIPKPGSTFQGDEADNGPVQFADRRFTGPLFYPTTIKSPMQRTTLFFEGHISPSWAQGTKLYSEILLTQRDSSQDRFQLVNPTFGYNNPVNPFASASDPFTTIQFWHNYKPKQKVQLAKILIGAEREWKNWNWNGFVSHSQSRGRSQFTVIQTDRLWHSIGINDYTGQDNDVCGPNAPTGCVPWNPFTPAALNEGKMTDAERRFLLKNDVGTTQFDQTMLEFSGTGEVLKLPAGEVQAAVGVAFRRDKIFDSPGPLRQSNNAYGISQQFITEGHETVSEVFGELDVPIAHDMPFTKDLRLTSSARYTRHQRAGEGGTYKVGLFWQPTELISFRGSQGTSFRAPSLSEMFRGQRYIYEPVENVDPCKYWAKDVPNGRIGATPTVQKNCAAAGVPGDFDGGGGVARVNVSGNPNLKPEESLAKTFGIIVTPPGWNLAVSVDFWDISIENAITTNYSDLVASCYSREDYPNSGFCKRVTRDPTSHVIREIDGMPSNAPLENALGFDVTMDWSHKLAIGTFTTSLNATHARKRTTANYEGDVRTQYKGTIGEPKWVGSLQSSMNRGRYTVTHTLNYTGDVTNQGWRGEDGTIKAGGRPWVTEDSYGVNSIDAFITHDLSLKYNADSWSFTGGITNLADEGLPRLSYSDDPGAPQRFGSRTNATQYIQGLIGRAFFANITKKF